MSFRTTLLVIIIITSIYSCKKTEDTTPETSSVAGVAKAVIVNKINDSIKITLSGLDLATGTVPHIIELTIPPNDTIILPREDLKNNTRYLYTWHSKDYRYSDWFQFHNSSKAIFEFDYIADSTDYTVIINGSNRPDLLICLNGSGLSSNWTAINAFDANGTSVWGGLNNRQKTHSFVLNRFHTVKHNFIDTNNKAKSSLLAFTLYDSTAHFSMATTSNDKYILSSNINFLSPLETEAEDTLFYCAYTIDSNSSIQFSTPYYQLIRTSVQQ